MIQHYRISEVRKHIDWIYFFHAWGFTPRTSQTPEAMHLLEDANRMLDKLENTFQTHAILRTMSANSVENDIWMEGIRLPFLRQQTAKEGEPYLCMSDFVRPASSGTNDMIGIFATSPDKDMEALYPDDSYLHMLAQTLADRLAEATAEKLHESVRQDFPGIRPAVGYPSLPDMSVNFLLDGLLDMKRIGIHLTENGMMQPHASVSGLMIAHPASRYFSVGKIDEEQLNDYASRRNLPVDVMRKFLGANLLTGQS